MGAVHCHLHPDLSFFLGYVLPLSGATIPASPSQQMPLLAASLPFISHPSTQQHPGDSDPLFSFIQKPKNTSLEA